MTGTNAGAVKANPSGNAEKFLVTFYRVVVPAYTIKGAGAGKAKTTVSNSTEVLKVPNIPCKAVKSESAERTTIIRPRCKPHINYIF